MMSTNSQLIAQQLMGAIGAHRIWGDIIINAKLFGAKGDGVADDTAALQAAINHAHDIGKTDIWLPAGTYKYTTLANVDGITFYGDGVILDGITPLDLVSFSELSDRINNIVAGAGDSNAEIVDARKSNSGITYPVLKARLDSERAQLIAADNQLSILIANEEAARITGDAALNDRINNLIINGGGDSNPEVVDARYSGPKLTLYPTLKSRLDAGEQDLIAHKAENANNLISSLVKRLQAGEVTKIKLIGDSITEGYGATGHVALAVNTNNGNPVIFDDGAGTKWYEALYTDPSWANLFRSWVKTNFPSVQFVNAGIGGATTTWALANKQYWIGNEDVVFVMLGTNDKYSPGSSITKYRTELTQFLEYIKDHSNLVIVMTPPPSSEDMDGAGNKNSWNNFTTADIDRVISQICIEHGYSHISIYKEILKLCKANGVQVNHTNIGYSDPHPNDLGHDFIWFVIQSELGLMDNKRSLFANRAECQQMLIDGNFEVAQAVPVVGTAVNNPAFLTYPVFDMWKLDGYVGPGDSLPTMITHKQVRISDSGKPADSVPGSRFCYRVTVNGAGSTASSEYGIIQPIYRGVSRYCVGSRLLFGSLWARSSIAGKKLVVNAYLNYGTGGSPSATYYTSGYELSLTDDWRKYDFVIPLPSMSDKTFGTNEDDMLVFRIILAGPFQNFVGAGDIEFTQVRLSTTGSGPFPIQPYEQVLEECMEWYEKSYNYSTPVPTASANGIEIRVVANNSIVNFQAYGSVSFRKRKRRVPNVTIYPFNPASGTNKVSNGDASGDLGENSGVAFNIGESGFSVRNQSGAAVTTNNNLVQFHWVADARL